MELASSQVINFVKLWFICLGLGFSLLVIELMAIFLPAIHEVYIGCFNEETFRTVQVTFVTFLYLYLKSSGSTTMHFYFLLRLLLQLAHY